MKPEREILEVKINPGGLVFHVKRGSHLRQLFLQEGILVDFPCGGKGKCGQCRVHICPPTKSGRGQSKKLSPEDLDSGTRLACEVIVEDNCVVTIPEGKAPDVIWREASEVGEAHIGEGEALVRRTPLKLSPPSLSDQRSDWERVKTVLQERGIRAERPDYTSLENLSGYLRENDWEAYLLLEDNTFLCSCTTDSDRFYGFAIDLGTTTVDLSLHNLETGRRIARKTLLNRQTAFGADVISRALAFESDRRSVREAALDTIQEGARMILQESGISSECIVRSVVVGNPIMIHILQDLNPVQLTLAPYINVISERIRRRPGDFGWSFQRHGYVETLPLISAFVGADTTGMILALGLMERGDTTISIDIGTNGEIVLARGGQLFATSAAAGPAFEGAQIACGTRAVPGSICDVRIESESVIYEVLGGTEPTGMCGTGLIKCVAELLNAGLVEDTGRLFDPEEVENKGLRSRLFNRDGMKAFAITDDRSVFITQKDIRELQLAKGAIRTALESLLEEVGVGWQEIDRIRMAGNFGAGMSGKAEMRIGLFPEIEQHKIDVVGNAALRGAAYALVSKTMRDRATLIPSRCRFLELAGTSSFQQRFTESMLF